MKTAIGCLIGLVFVVSASAEPLLEGRVRLASGEPVANAQIAVFDMSALRQGAIARARTDGTGYFALPLAALGGPALPAQFALGPNYPNPFNPSTIIPYQIPTATHVRLEVFNVLGQRIATLVNREQSAGAHTAQWDATDAAGRAVGAGVYIYRLSSGGATVSRRMVLIDGQAGIPAAGAAGPMPMQASAWERVDAAAGVYGLTVVGDGLVAYVNPAFRVGVDAADIVLEAHDSQPRMKRMAGGILGDVNNDGQVDISDALYVMLYIEDNSTILPNNGDISLGDVNEDGGVNFADALILIRYIADPADPLLPTGIGDAGGSSDDHSNTRSGATDLPLGSSRSGEIETGSDVDYFRVQVGESGTLTVYTTGSLDTKGELQSSSGSRLASNDDGGNGSNFRIERSVSAGTYYVKVESYSSRTGSYTIHASFESSSGGGGGGGSSDDHSNTRSGATEVSLGSSRSGEIETGSDVDYFRVQVGESGTLTVYTTGSLDTKGELQSSSGSRLASNDDGGSGSNFRIERSVSAGTYYVKVESYSSRTGSYTIHASFESSSGGGGGGGSSDDHSNTRSGATEVSLGSSRSGEIETGSDVDYFRVQVGESGTLTVYTTGSLDTKGELQSSSGSRLASNDDGGNGSNFRIERSVSAGTYYVKVEGFSSSSTGSYTIHASFSSGGDGGDSGDAISLSFSSCSGSYLFGNSGSATVSITGTVRALRSVSSVTLTGYANGEWVGVDFIGSLSAGESENFSISGIIYTSGSSLNCRVESEGTVFNSAKVTAGDAESSQQVRVQGSLSPASAILNRKQPQTGE